MNGFHIREAKSADAGAILGLIRELAEYERLAHEVVATEESLRRALFENDRRAAEVLLGELDGRLVGFALYFHNFSTFLGQEGIYLEDLYVQPAFRGRGFGQALFTRVARVARERGCGRYEWSVLDWNEPAIGFYKKLGSVSMDDWTTFRLTGTALDAVARLST